MSDSDTDSEVIAAGDEIIIEEVKARDHLYNPNALHIGIPIKERRSDSFKSIAKKIEKETDLEFTGAEVENRWNIMKKGFVRAINSGKSYYLQKHLMFLSDFIKPKKKGISKPYVRTPYKPLRLSPVKIELDISSDEEILKYKDVLESMNHFSKKADNQNTLTAQKNAQDNKKDETFEMMSEVQYFQNLRKDISTIPKVTKVPCLMEICQETHKYFADCKT